MTTAAMGPNRYVSWRASTLGSITERLEHDLLLGMVGPLAACRVLDIGCGDGELTAKLAAAGAIVTGIDSNPEMVACARAKAPSATILPAEARRLPFGADTFDLVVVNTVLCLVGDRRAVLAEVVRVLRPGGRLVLGELGRWSLWALKRRIKGMLGSNLWRHSRFFHARSLIAELSEAGLMAGVARGAVFYPPTGWAAHLMAPVDSCFGRYTTIGAAYLAVAATKPDPSGMDRDDR